MLASEATPSPFMSNSISFAFAVIPSPPTTFIVLDDAIVPPPVNPLPAVIETPLWSICSLATNPLKLSCTIALSSVLIASAATEIPVPAPTFKVTPPLAPPPVRPEPAVTPVISPLA